MRKPIHKFNGGNGATLCHICFKIIATGHIDALYCDEHDPIPREIKPGIKLYLDDFRDPHMSREFMYNRIGMLSRTYTLDQWVVVRSYPEFVKYVQEHAGEIAYISFDHDLASGHYQKNMQEGVLNYDAKDFDTPENKTGYHCAKFLKDLYKKLKLELPVMYVHSMNPVGTQNIINLFK